MVRKARVWLDGDLAWPLEDADDSGGVAVLTQTAVLLKLCAGESLPVEEAADEEPEPAPIPKKSEKPKRHLAGANWLDDWTRYLPTRSNPSKRKRQSPPGEA